MSAVMGIVRGHKGAIFVYSEENNGTTIRVVFPEVNEAGSKEKIREKTEDNIELQKLITGEILIIDDDPDVLKASCSLVEYLGFETLTAEDGIEGLAILEKYKEKIILVLLDLTMPNLDGVQTFEEIQKRKIDIPVILTSGFSEQEAVKKFKSKGLTGFLQKPYQLEVLKIEIIKALATR
jgi:CheY-like chemotaxis protein